MKGRVQTALAEVKSGYFPFSRQSRLRTPELVATVAHQRHSGESKIVAGQGLRYSPRRDTHKSLCFVLTENSLDGVETHTQVFCFD
eukprot:COSAG05_NODE_2204_length_3399_cov_4.885593_6_plen_86_part_00